MHSPIPCATPVNRFPFVSFRWNLSSPSRPQQPRKAAPIVTQRYATSFSHFSIGFLSSRHSSQMCSWTSKCSFSELRNGQTACEALTSPLWALDGFGTPTTWTTTGFSLEEVVFLHKFITFLLKFFMIFVYLRRQVFHVHPSTCLNMPEPHCLVHLGPPGCC